MLLQCPYSYKVHVLYSFDLYLNTWNIDLQIGFVIFLQMRTWLSPLFAVDVPFLIRIKRQYHANLLYAKGYLHRDSAKQIQWTTVKNAIFTFYIHARSLLSCNKIVMAVA